MVKRLKRLYIPVCGWGGIYYFVYSIFCDINPKELLFQITTGVSRLLNPPLYYLIDVIVITLFLYSMKKLIYYTETIVLFTIIICFIGEYTGVNYAIWGNMPYEIKYTGGRLATLLPYAMCGVFWKKHYRDREIFCSVFLLLTYILCIKEKFYEFGYEGICLFAFTNCVFEMINNKCLGNLELILEKKSQWISMISEYTLGIFAMHYGIGRIFNTVLAYFGIHINNFISCIMIWLFSLMGSFAIDRLFKLHMFVR